MKKTVELSNGLTMPRLIQGLPLIMGLKGINLFEFEKIIRNSIEADICGFDTSHDYGKSEEYIGRSVKKLIREGIINRDQVFITSKIGNSQQYGGDIEECVDKSLRKMGMEYIDCMLLHWPVPDRFIHNWQKLIDVYKKGKVRSIGIANVQVRHLKALEDASVSMLPHIVQTEIHPFNTCVDMRNYCAKNDIALQSCSSLCLMIAEVRENITLIELGKKYHKSVAQIMLRWGLQNNVSPVFRAFKENHIVEMSDLFTFEIGNQDMELINSLNINFRYHPESLNCAGY